MKRIVTTLTLASGIICGLLLGLLPVSYHLSLSAFDAKQGVISNHSVSITAHSRCGFSDGGVWFFSLAVPYTGSIRSVGKNARETREASWIVGDYGFIRTSFVDENGEIARKDRSGELPGIYYRHFTWWNREYPWWTLKVSLWYPILVFAVLPTLWIIRHRRQWLRR